jgi:hypothetical protein
MAQQIKPKQCGETAWYIPNQAGFVPEINEQYWLCSHDGSESSLNFCGLSNDYAMIEVGNCFETRKEARDAFVKPVDPAPVNWDEFCEIVNASGDLHWLTVSNDGVITHYTVRTSPSDDLNRMNFESGMRLWRSKESLEAWIDKQKGDSNSECTYQRHPVCCHRRPPF